MSSIDSEVTASALASIRRDGLSRNISAQQWASLSEHHPFDLREALLAFGESRGVPSVAFAGAEMPGIPALKNVLSDILAVLSLPDWDRLRTFFRDEIVAEVDLIVAEICSQPLFTTKETGWILDDLREHGRFHFSAKDAESLRHHSREALRDAGRAYALRWNSKSPESLRSLLPHIQAYGFEGLSLSDKIGLTWLLPDDTHEALRAHARANPEKAIQDAVRGSGLDHLPVKTWDKLLIHFHGGTAEGLRELSESRPQPSKATLAATLKQVRSYGRGHVKLCDWQSAERHFPEQLANSESKFEDQKRRQLLKEKATHKLSAGEVTTLLAKIEDYGLDENHVNLGQWEALREYHSERLMQSLQAYTRSVRPASVSEPFPQPMGGGPADQLLSAKPEYSRSAIAHWPDRNRCPLLGLLAKLYNICSELVLDHEALDGFGDLGLLDLVMTRSTWAIEALTDPFYNQSTADRRSSFIGGFPWTCGKYPWPRNYQNPQGFLSPLFQLNLSELDLSAIAEFPPLLVQGWGGEIKFFTRVIPLSEIADQSPDATMQHWCQEHLGYLGNNRGSIGARLYIGQRLFTHPADLLLSKADRGLNVRYRLALSAAQVAEAESLISEIVEMADKMDANMPRFVEGNHFGGSHHPCQSTYEPSESCKALFEYHSFGGEAGASDQDGLNIYWNGSMQVSFAPSDLWSGYQVTGSR